MARAGGHTVLVDRLRSWEEKDLITWKKVRRESKSESTVIHREEKVWISICALVSSAARILMCLRLCELSWRADRTWLQSINPPPLVLSLSFFHSLTSKIFIQLVSSVKLTTSWLTRTWKQLTSLTDWLIFTHSRHYSVQSYLTSVVRKMTLKWPGLKAISSAVQTNQRLLADSMLAAINS